MLSGPLKDVILGIQSFCKSTANKSDQANPDPAGLPSDHSGGGAHPCVVTSPPSAQVKAGAEHALEALSLQQPLGPPGLPSLSSPRDTEEQVSE